MELKSILEAVLFAAQKPLTPWELRDLLKSAAQQHEDPAVAAFKKTSEDDILAALETLKAEHAAAMRSYELVCVAGAWQFVSKGDYAPWLMTMLGQKVRPPKLSQPALETLTIVAYRQPITRAEIEQVRGVAVDGVMQTLVERGLVEQVGRAEVIGRPALYGTTALFLEYFGLRQLEDMPEAEELRRIPVKKPDSLLTVDGNGGIVAPASPAESTPAAAPAEATEAAAPNPETNVAATPESPAIEKRDGESATEPPAGGA